MLAIRAPIYLLAPVAKWHLLTPTIAKSPATKTSPNLAQMCWNQWVESSTSWEFSPRKLGKISNLTCAYFSDGLKPTTNQSSTEAATFFFGSIFRLTAASHQPHWCTLRTWANCWSMGRFFQVRCISDLVEDVISKHKFLWFLMISNLEIGNKQPKNCVVCWQLTWLLHCTGSLAEVAKSRRLSILCRCETEMIEEIMIQKVWTSHIIQIIEVSWHDQIGAPNHGTL